MARLGPPWLLEWQRDWERRHPEGTTGNGTVGDTVGQPIREGSRNARLTSMGGSARRAGATHEEIETYLLAVNGRCDPPLDEDEVRKIARSVARYEPDAPLLAQLILTGQDSEFPSDGQT